MSILQEVRELPSAKSDLRKFGWTVGIAFALLWAFLKWGFPYVFGGEGHDVAILWQIGAVLVLLGTLVPKILKPVYFAWMTFALALGFVMTRVILTLFFFLVITPFALVFRLIGRDALHRKIERRSASYWIEKEVLIADRTRYEKFF